MTARRKKQKFVYFSADGNAQGKAPMKELPGRKAPNLAEMAGLGLPVPPGLPTPTELSGLYDKTRDPSPPGLAPAAACGPARRRPGGSRG